MKKQNILKTASAVILVCVLCAAFSGCEHIDIERADKCAVDFITGFLNGDEELIKTTLHPDYTEKAMPDEQFYESLKKIGIVKGKPFNGLNSEDKRYSDDTDLDGRVLVCDFTADIDYIFYSVEIIILDSKSGYGIVGCDIDFCTDDKYFQSEE